MDAGHPPGAMRARTVAGILAVAALGAAILPIGAQAEPIKPHSPTHVVTPVAPAPSTSPTSGPNSVPAPAPSAAPVPNAGPGSKGGLAGGSVTAQGSPAQSSGSAQGSGSAASGPSRLIDPAALKGCDVRCMGVWRDTAYGDWKLASDPYWKAFYLREFTEIDSYLQAALGEAAANPPGTWAFSRTEWSEVSGYRMSAIDTQAAARERARRIADALVTPEPTEGPLDTLFNAIIQSICPKGDYQSVNYQVEQGGSGTSACY